MVPGKSHRGAPLPKDRWILEMFLTGIFHPHRCPASFCATFTFQVEKVHGALHNSWTKFLSKTSFRLCGSPLPRRQGKGLMVIMAWAQRYRCISFSVRWQHRQDGSLPVYFCSSLIIYLLLAKYFWRLYVPTFPSSSFTTCCTLIFTPAVTSWAFCHLSLFLYSNVQCSLT